MTAVLISVLKLPSAPIKIARVDLCGANVADVYQRRGEREKNPLIKLDNMCRGAEGGGVKEISGFVNGDVYMAH